MLLAGVAMAGLAACAQVGPVAGGGEGRCRTVFVYTPAANGSGGVAPVQRCSGLPRETLQAAAPADAARAVSAAATATRPEGAQSYGSIEESLENADMAAFMARVREDFANDRNKGAWGYLVIDALAADDLATAQRALDGMGADRRGQQLRQLGANQLRPWVLAAAGRTSEAKSSFDILDQTLPPLTLVGHRALMAEATGDPEAALGMYAEATETLEAPDPEDAGTANFLARAILFNSQRQLVLRHAALLRALNRDADAIAEIERVLAESPDDGFVRNRLDAYKRGEKRPSLRTLKVATAQAIADEADLINERQSIMEAVMGRGGKAPFNHLLASMRQASLLLDPDNGDVRITEVGQLYDYGHFEAALRLAQMGDPPPLQRSSLMVTAGLSALELGSASALEELVQQALRTDNSYAAKLIAANALISANSTDQALRVIDQAMTPGLKTPDRVMALLTRGQAKFQGGDIEGAVEAAREARKLDDDRSSQQFLASMLVASPKRQEGLQILREILTASPEDTGIMNNLGYSLIDGHESNEELEEGFKLLKEASRLTPDEPNLLDSMGWAYYHYGDFREAKRFIELAQENYQPFKHWELEDHMGDIHWRLGDEAAARAAWKSSLAARPPRHEIQRIEGKVANGLTTPAPVKRNTPEVPLTRQGGRSDI
jgi:tetratricopeptide (TPR) repeat protein